MGTLPSQIRSRSVDHTTVTTFTAAKETSGWLFARAKACITPVGKMHLSFFKGADDDDGRTQDSMITRRYDASHTQC